MRKQIRRALVSVFDKDRLIEIGEALSAAGIEILSTGSTAKNLVDAGIEVSDVSSYTGFPEIMDGRVKTLHSRVHSGILADQNNPEHLAAIADLDIKPFDLVIVNLYPFAATVASGANFAESLEQIDIGGPSMLRAAAKNHGSVAVICQPSQYDQLLGAIKSGGFTELERRQLALEAFRTTAEYDLAIATWLGQSDDKDLPDWFGHIWHKENSLRYGENPHQAAAIYSGGPAGIVDAKQLHGKEMSFNNYTDAEAAWRAERDLLPEAAAPSAGLCRRPRILHRRRSPRAAGQ
jgi:phosphoribosylaminoimidazolecarboxamide formyltransferase/IMP cyclohydrolase